MKSDIEIAQSIQLKHIEEIAGQLNINKNELELYGKYKAKLPLHLINEEKASKTPLVLVTAITPTPAGEGKTTTSIGVAQALNKIGKKATVVLREPSLGPVFGVKGGAAGGGYSQVLPMEDINLHFTGDMSAVEKAHNLLSALIDNNIQSKTNNLNIDPRTIVWPRVMDMNDRSLRDIVIGLGGSTQGVPRQAGFDITAASEVMAILCMSESLSELKERLANIFIGYTHEGTPVYAKDLKAQGAMAALLKNAIKPNLVQTLEGTPAIIHGGPFANIAQGTNTILATKLALSLSEIVVTEAGFASELGAEKFFDIKCRKAKLKPSATILVATIRALKYHGGVKLKDLKQPDLQALKKGLENLEKHIEIIRSFGMNPIVAINKFSTDTEEEIHLLEEQMQQKGVKIALTENWEKGGEGAVGLAEVLIDDINKNESEFTPAYKLETTPKEKIELLAKKLYGASSVEYTLQAKSELEKIEKLGWGHLPVCMAKTQKSISDNPDLKGCPKDFVFKIREVELASGAGFIIPIAGSIMRMPGLPDTPSAEQIDIDDTGKIVGLF